MIGWATGEGSSRPGRGARRERGREGASERMGWGEAARTVSGE